MSTNPSSGAPALPATHPYSQAKRAFYGLLWLAWATVGVIGGFALLGSGTVGGGLFGLAFGIFAAVYDYRIWTWQARRLWLLFII
ncbi:MAG TPA: hypothetical protein VHA75_11430 [Rugosimonospora sp.]|nr:hypothetical protein [Rugosimonospora sp.]